MHANSNLAARINPTSVNTESMEGIIQIISVWSTEVKPVNLRIMETVTNQVLSEVIKKQGAKTITLAASHNRTDLSNDAVASWVEFGLKRTSVIRYWWSSGVLSVCRVSMFQRIAWMNHTRCPFDQWLISILQELSLDCINLSFPVDFFTFVVHPDERNCKSKNKKEPTLKKVQKRNKKDFKKKGWLGF